MPIFNMAGGGGTQQKIYKDTNGYSGIKIANTFTVPTKYDDGDAVATALDMRTFPSIFTTILNSVESLVLPEYFTEFYFAESGSRGRNVFDKSVLRTIKFSGEKGYLGDLDFIKDLRTVDCPNLKYNYGATTKDIAINCGTLTGTYSGNALSLKLPSVESVILNLGKSGSPVTVEDCDFSGVTYYNKTNQQEFGRYINGTLEFPSCTTIQSFPMTASGHSTWYFPELTHWEYIPFYSHDGDGTMDLYIGGHMPESHVWSVALQMIEAGRLTIHIPPGLTTTKQALITAGFTEGQYVEDYII